MREPNWKFFWLKIGSGLVAIALFYIFTFTNCVNRKPSLNATFYNFEFDSESYRIRSISSSKDTLSMNELISKKFVAADYNQDGFIDEISMGTGSLSQAQKIYEYALLMLSQQNRLREVDTKENRYQYVNSEYKYEIKSFHPIHGEPFNQFKIIKNGRVLNPSIIIGIDQNADGSIDAIIKGTISLDEIQLLYADVIKKGFAKKELIKIDHKILVK